MSDVNVWQHRLATIARLDIAAKKAADAKKKGTK